MKRVVLDIINYFLSLLGAKIVANSQDQFTMVYGLQRVLDHDIEVKNIIDIGASDGKWSMKAMSLFPQAQFQAIEPLTE